MVFVYWFSARYRNEAIVGHKPFLVLADHLTRAGIAVLRFDDRGFGESGGDFATATSEDFMQDALAGVSYLAARPEVADRRAEVQCNHVLRAQVPPFATCVGQQWRGYAASR